MPTTRQGLVSRAKRASVSLAVPAFANDPLPSPSKDLNHPHYPAGGARGFFHHQQEASIARATASTFTAPPPSPIPGSARPDHLKFPESGSSTPDGSEVGREESVSPTGLPGTPPETTDYSLDIPTSSPSLALFRDATRHQPSPDEFPFGSPPICPPNWSPFPPLNTPSSLKNEKFFSAIDPPHVTPNFTLATRRRRPPILRLILYLIATSLFLSFLYMATHDPDHFGVTPDFEAITKQRQLLQDGGLGNLDWQEFLRKTRDKSEGTKQRLAKWMIKAQGLLPPPRKLHVAPLGEPVASTARPGSKKKQAHPKGTPKKELLGLHQPPRRYRHAKITTTGASGDEQSPNGVLTSEHLAVLYETAKEKFLREEDDWRAYEWVAPNVDPSLRAFIETLSSDQKKLRSWIRDLRLEPSPSAHPVGLAAITPFPTGDLDADLEANTESVGSRNSDSKRAKVPANRLADDDPSASAPLREKARSGHSTSQANTNSPLRSLGPGDFVGGNLVKWGALVQEAREDLGGICGGNRWLWHYKEMHEQMMLGEKVPSAITYMAEEAFPSGGIGDRMTAMVSAFLFALVTKRAFFAEWQHPIPLDVLFDSPYIDWSTSSFKLDEHPIFANTSLAHSASVLDTFDFSAPESDAAFGTSDWSSPQPGSKLVKGLERRDLAFASPWIRYYSNRGFSYRAFSYEAIQPRIDILGLKPQTAFSCMYNYLFRPKTSSLPFIADYTSLLSLPTVMSIGIEIIVGGDADVDDKTNTFDKHKAFFRCAEQIAETYLFPDQKLVYLLVTDSAALRQDARKRLGDKLVVSGLDVAHNTLDNDDADDAQRVILENAILTRTDYKIITKGSSFGKLAAFASAQKSSTVVLPPTSEQSGRRSVDCRLESSFTSWDVLSM